MEALRGALDGPTPFPHGLFWFIRAGSRPAAAVTELLRDARSRGTQAGYIEICGFDELMNKLFLDHQDSLPQVRELLKSRRASREPFAMTDEFYSRADFGREARPAPESAESAPLPPTVPSVASEGISLAHDGRATRDSEGISVPLDAAAMAHAYMTMTTEMKRRAFAAAFASLALATAARDPRLVFKDPTGVLGWEFHNGHSAIFGLPIVVGLFYYFLLGVRRASAFAELVADTLTRHRRPDQAEMFIFRRPFAHGPDEDRFGAGSLALMQQFFLFAVPIVCCAALLHDFLELRRPGYMGNGWADLLFGLGGPWHEGFAPVWHRNPRGVPMPWIYPPYQTWTYLSLFLLMLYWSAKSICVMNPQVLGLIEHCCLYLRGQCQRFAGKTHAVWRRMRMASRRAGARCP
jgi:hypothetical protein